MSDTDSKPDAPSPGKPPAVGLVGLGNLGMPIALALLDAGWSVTVFDRRAELVERAGAQGARAAADVSGLADQPMLAIAVTDDTAVDEVLIGSGLLSALRAGSAVAVHSTILPVTAQRLGEQAVAAGIALVDAPVSGGAARARAGDLTVFAGGSPDALHRAKPYLDTVASTVVHLGGAGAGSAAKLGNQLMMFASLAATYEALDLAAVYDVAPEAFLRAVTHSTGDCWIAREWGFFDRTAAEYDASGLPLRYRPWSKDLWDLVATGRAHDLSLPVAGMLAQLMPGWVEAHAHGSQP
ncbi:NAD(P)-dependent oxidoreductase [Rugosimonospora africana]|uniref:NAD(P)-dependent oxidoreductase n=1 Tax=Rugosimonospora africana TaxID=556532 RepID=UPI0019441829|nr:NAD(P)-dependent oxidoreductase [Rugosimonospora africana]